LLDQLASVDHGFHKQDLAERAWPAAGTGDLKGYQHSSIIAAPKWEFNKSLPKVTALPCILVTKMFLKSATKAYQQ